VVGVGLAGNEGGVFLDLYQVEEWDRGTWEAANGEESSNGVLGVSVCVVRMCG
jgi:hypothetical protein